MLNTELSTIYLCYSLRYLNSLTKDELENYSEKKLKNLIICIVVLSFFTFFVFHQTAAATITGGWDFTTHTLEDGGVGAAAQNIFNFTDDTDADAIPQTIQVNVKSIMSGGQTRDSITMTAIEVQDPSATGFPLVPDGTTGIYAIRNIVFSPDTARFSVGNTATVTQQDATKANNGVVDTLTLTVKSTSDSVGINFKVVETNANSGIFKGTLAFTSGPSVVNNAIKVNPGDIVSIKNAAGRTENAAIVNATVSGLQADVGDTIVASYNGVTASTPTTSIIIGGGGGGGAGGVVRPGLVLDVIARIVGGSPYIVQPPSFGGSSYHFLDGLTFTQGKSKSTFDISHYNQDLQKQVMVTGEKVNMTFKTFESYRVDGVIHMGMYLIPRGQDMITPNSIAAIEWDKGKSVIVKDPNKILHNATVASNADDTYQYAQFTFIPAKSYNKMSFLVRAWNDHMYTTDVRVHDAVEAAPISKTLPPGVVKYDNFAKLQDALYNDKFYKPGIMSHIHDVNSVFPDSNGNVYWLYNQSEHSVTLVISDTNDNELFEHKGMLQPFEVEKKRDYGFMNFTTVQLNRQNVDQIQKALESEEEKAKTTEIEMKIIRISKW